MSKFHPESTLQQKYAYCIYHTLLLSATEHPTLLQPQNNAARHSVHAQEKPSTRQPAHLSSANAVPIQPVPMHQCPFKKRTFNECPGSATAVTHLDAVHVAAAGLRAYALLLADIYADLQETGAAPSSLVKPRFHNFYALL